MRCFGVIFIVFHVLGNSFQGICQKIDTEKINGYCSSIHGMMIQYPPHHKVFSIIRPNEQTKSYINTKTGEFLGTIEPIKNVRVTINGTEESEEKKYTLTNNKHNFVFEPKTFAVTYAFSILTESGCQFKSELYVPEPKVDTSGCSKYRVSYLDNDNQSFIVQLDANMGVEKAKIKEVIFYKNDEVLDSKLTQFNQERNTAFVKLSDSGIYKAKVTLEDNECFSYTKEYIYDKCLDFQKFTKWGL